MQDLLSLLQLRVNDRIFLKDPGSSELGRNIVRKSVELIHEMGLEGFTFKKLSQQLGTTESAVYRYFENKHKLLIYLLSWYWGWLEYKLVFSTVNIHSAEEKVHITLSTLANPVGEVDRVDFADLYKLLAIAVAESPKVYLTHEVDRENRQGLFMAYMRLVRRISGIILELNPKYRFPDSLASLVLESVYQQRFFAEHFPNLSNFDGDPGRLQQFFCSMIINTVKNG